MQPRQHRAAQNQQPAQDYKHDERDVNDYYEISERAVDQA
jgi:hypothetical protein